MKPIDKPPKLMGFARLNPSYADARVGGVLATDGFAIFRERRNC
jgi:hypothetical protein